MTNKHLIHGINQNTLHIYKYIVMDSCVTINRIKHLMEEKKKRKDKSYLLFLMSTSTQFFMILAYKSQKVPNFDKTNTILLKKAVSIFFFPYTFFFLIITSDVLPSRICLIVLLKICFTVLCNL